MSSDVTSQDVKEAALAAEETLEKYLEQRGWNVARKDRGLGEVWRKRDFGTTYYVESSLSAFRLEETL